MGANEITIAVFGFTGIGMAVLCVVLLAVMRIKSIDRNALFGYRTAFSLSSDETWRWCNDKASLYGIVLSLFGLAAHVFVFVLSLEHQWPYWISCITMMLPVFFLIVMIPFIEIIGRVKFSEPKGDGKKKKRLVTAHYERLASGTRYRYIRVKNADRSELEVVSETENGEISLQIVDDAGREVTNMNPLENGTHLIPLPVGYKYRIIVHVRKHYGKYWIRF